MREDQAAQPVRVECLQRADPREVEQLRLGQRLLHDDAALLDHARRTHVLLDHVRRREAGLVVEGPPPLAGQAADVDLDRVRPGELRGRVAHHQVADAGRDAAVHHGRDSVIPREPVQVQRVLGHEADIDVRAARLDDRGQRPVAERAGQRTHHQVEAGRELAHGRRHRKVRADAGDTGGLAQALEDRLLEVRHRDRPAPVARQVERDRRPDHAAAENENARAHRLFPSPAASRNGGRSVAP